MCSAIRTPFYYFYAIKYPIIPIALNNTIIIIDSIVTIFYVHVF